MRKRATARFCILKRRFSGTLKKKKHPNKKESESRNRHPGRVSEQNIIGQVWALAEPLCESESLELIQVEYQRESAGRVLRLYIDKPGGIRLDDCVAVSRQLGDILDVNLDDAGPYNLEVTSPGPERPLAKIKDFDRFKNNRAKIKTRCMLNGQKNFKGVILGVTGDQVKLQIDEQTITIPYADISKARLTK
jgi:ribosome maturation factor RimP